MMSTFTHINQPPLMNDVLGTTVPAQWNHLVSHSLKYTTDTSLPRVTRACYEAPHPGSLARGEIWTIAAEKNPTATAKTHKVESGSLQMYVISGSDSITKNGQSIFVRPGEKVSFRSGETISFTGESKLCILTRNERATLGTCLPTQPLAPPCPPTLEDVERVRVLLGVTSAPLSHSYGSASRHGDLSSYGWVLPKTWR